MNQPDNVTQKSWQAISAWASAQKAVQRAKADLNTAEVNLLNATNNAGKFLCPQDASEGETFNLWVGDGLLAVSRKGNDYFITWRTPPSMKCKVEMHL